MPNPNEAPREVTSSVNRGVGKTHPMLIIAAVAVTLFAGVGIGVMTGIIPNAHSGATAKVDSAMPPVPTAMGASAGIGSAADTTASASTQGATARPEASSQTPATHKPASTRAHTPVATKTAASTPTPVFAQNSASDSTRVRAEPVVCRNCGTIDSINIIAKQGEGSGAGAVLGGVLGGVLGHQIGNGRGKDLATVAGAVGGAMLGNSVEKNAKTAKSYDIRVRMEDNTFQTLRYETEPDVRVGDKVRVENGRALRG